MLKTDNTLNHNALIHRAAYQLVNVAGVAVAVLLVYGVRLF